ncbi:dihydrolipoyl dehydrogenase family protein [Microbaculum sp. FT89]|uniref:dihydrolipoyl dehydrogenase family protein n=1 Tax=Microbaculum sp. FT89 TaxID=3447298 RepID=UPI003F52B299
MADVLKPDICVIGAGSGGLSVAAAAAAFGVPVVLIEKGRMGGDCLNTGCVPSKALIAAARRAQAMRDAAPFGVAAVDPQVNFRKVHDHVHDVIDAIAPTDSVERFRAMGVTVLEAAARFEDPRTVIAGDTRIAARRFVVATGSKPAVPPIPGLDAVDYHTNETIFDVTRKPAHLIVIGGGPIGLELAQSFRRLGSEVTVLEADRALGREDPELAEVVLTRLALDGVRIRDKATVARVGKRGANGVRVVVETEAGKEAIDGSDLLVATGRAAVTAGLDLEKARVFADEKGIRVDRKLRSSNRKVYAVGDVARGPQFTHVANYHAGIAVRNILFRLGAKVSYGHVPRVTYTDPELAQVGMTEAEAAERYGRIRVLRWPFGENDRARAERETDGFVKVVTTKGGRILGVGIAGAQAGEIIQMWGLAILKGLDIKAMTAFVSPYPTLSEIGKRAAIEFYRPSLSSPMVRRSIAFLRKFG